MTLLRFSLASITIMTAALLAPTTSWAQSEGAAASKTTADDTKRATAHFVKGTELFKAQKYAEALKAFRDSYEAVKSPNSHLYVARCMVEMGDLKGAYVQFGQVIAEAEERAAADPKYARTREAAALERNELEAKLAFVTVSPERAEEGATLIIGSEELPRDRWGAPVPVAPGAVTITLKLPDGATSTKELSLGPGQRKRVSIERAPKPPAPPPRDPSSSTLLVGAYTSGGVGLLGFVTFAIAGAMSEATYADLKAKCGGTTGGCHGLDVSSEVNQGKTQQAIADVGLAMGLAGLTTGVALFLLGHEKNDSPPGPKAALSVGPSWIGISGQF